MLTQHANNKSVRISSFVSTWRLQYCILSCASRGKFAVIYVQPGGK